MGLRTIVSSATAARCAAAPAAALEIEQGDRGAGQVRHQHTRHVRQPGRELDIVLEDKGVLKAVGEYALEGQQMTECAAGDAGLVLSAGQQGRIDLAAIMQVDLPPVDAADDLVLDPGPVQLGPDM